MTLHDAMTVREGMIVVSPHSSPPYLPLRVTQAWVNEKHTIARFRIHTLHDAWVDSAGVEFPPQGARWSRIHSRWEK